MEEELVQRQEELERRKALDRAEALRADKLPTTEQLAAGISQMVHDPEIHRVSLMSVNLHSLFVITAMNRSHPC